MCVTSFVLDLMTHKNVNPLSSGTLSSPTALPMTNVCVTSTGLGADELQQHHHHFLCWWHGRRALPLQAGFCLYIFTYIDIM